MFINVKRQKRDKQESASASSRLAEAALKTSSDGLLLLDAKAKVLLPTSPSLAALLRRQDFTNLTFEKLLAPLVSAKNLSAARTYVTGLLAGGEALPNPLSTLDVRLANPDGSSDSAQFTFEFSPVFVLNEPRLWLVRITDVTEKNQMARDLEELRSQTQTQSEILRSVLKMGAARFGEFIQKTDASMKTIAAVLKKPAREEDAFRLKLEEILNEVDRIRREAAAFRITAVEGAARVFEDSLQDLRSRSGLSGSDFLPLAVKLDQLYDQFATVKTVTAAASPAPEPDAAPAGSRTTHNGTAIMEAPKFPLEADTKAALGTGRAAPAGSLDSTLQSLTDHVAQEYQKQVTLESNGLQLIPAKYMAVIKNIAIQLIRNSVMHGIEPPSVRQAAGKLARGTLHLDFRTKEGNFEMLFEDDGCGLVPDQVRAVAVARGVVSSEAAARMRDREAIKLIFKSRYTTLAGTSQDAAHGTGMSLVRRYVHEAGGRIALASLAGHETRFKITLPALASADADPAAGTDAQAA